MRLTYPVTIGAIYMIVLKYQVINTEKIEKTSMVARSLKGDEWLSSTMQGILRTVQLFCMIL